jgi:hypothetical protein
VQRLLRLLGFVCIGARQTGCLQLGWRHLGRGKIVPEREDVKKKKNEKMKNEKKKNEKNEYIYKKKRERNSVS